MKRVLKLKTSGDDVRLFQKRLKELNYYQGDINGYYSVAFQEAVSSYQIKNGLIVNGNLDISTQNKLNKKQIELNIDEPSLLYVGQDGLKIYNSPISPDRYYSVKTNKNTILITNTNNDVSGIDIPNYWPPILDKNSTLLTAHHYSIDMNGKVLNYFDDSFWSNSTKTANESMSSKSIIIDVINFGHIIKSNGVFHTSFGKHVDEDCVYSYKTPFKGYKYWHKYTDKQTKSLDLLVKYLMKKWNIAVNDLITEEKFGYHPKWSSNGGIRLDSQIKNEVRGINPQENILSSNFWKPLI